MFGKKINLLRAFKSFSRKKKTFTIIGILVALVVGISIWRNFTKPSKYSLEAAQMGSVLELVSETGNVTTAGAIPIYSTTTGMVEEVYVSNGSTVVDGDKLYKVKSTATKQEKDAALSTYLAAKSALEAAKSTQSSLQASKFTQWDEFKNLAESDSYENDDGISRDAERNVAEFHISQKEWFAAESAYKNQQQVISQTAVGASAAWRAYQATQDSTVMAHLDGEIRNLGVSKGDIVTVPTTLALASTPPGLVLINTATNVKTTVKINVGETDVLKVHEGQSAEVEFDALDGKIFKASVERVDTVAVPTQGVVNFAVYVVLDEELDEIKRGMTADVDIVTAQKENVLTVSSSAVKPYEGGRAVRVVNKKDEIEYVPVEIGSRGIEKTEIISGIDEGVEVVVALANDQIERSRGLF